MADGSWQPPLPLSFPVRLQVFLNPVPALGTVLRASTKLLQRVVARTAEVARSDGGDRTEVLPCYPMFGIFGQSGRSRREY